MLDVTVGGTTSNSYVTVDEVDDYMTTRNHSSSWNDILEDDKEKYLISATNQIDWFIKFNGYKASSDQSLSFPRTNCFDYRLNEYVASNIIPTRVKYAVYELILASLNEDRFADNPMAGLQQVQVGSLKVVANSVGTWQTKKKPMPDIIYNILSGILDPLSNTMFSQVVRY